MVTRSRVGTTRPNPRYAGHVSTISPLPRSYKEAFNDPNWRNAMFDRLNHLLKIKLGTSVPRSEGANIRATIQTVLRLAISRHWPVHQLDVKNAFLHGDLAKTVYMHQPLGFWDPEHPDYCKYAIGDFGAVLIWLVVNSSRTPVDTDPSWRDGGTPVVDHNLYQISKFSSYLTFTRPDITYAVQQGTLDYGLQLFSSTTDSLIAYSDLIGPRCPTTATSYIGEYCAEAEYRSVGQMLLAERCDLEFTSFRFYHVLLGFHIDIFTKGLTFAF
ncbi:ribonuclease H-like domain-containing protein [Tanacetum coccineum]